MGLLVVPTQKLTYPVDQGAKEIEGLLSFYVAVLGGMNVVSSGVPQALIQGAVTAVRQRLSRTVESPVVRQESTVPVQLQPSRRWDPVVPAIRSDGDRNSFETVEEGDWGNLAAACAHPQGSEGTTGTQGLSSNLFVQNAGGGGDDPEPRDTEWVGVNASATGRVSVRTRHDEQQFVAAQTPAESLEDMPWQKVDTHPDGNVTARTHYTDTSSYCDECPPHRVRSVHSGSGDVLRRSNTSRSSSSRRTSTTKVDHMKFLQGMLELVVACLGFWDTLRRK